MTLFSGLHKLTALYNILQHIERYAVKMSEATFQESDTYMTIKTVFMDKAKCVYGQGKIMYMCHKRSIDLQERTFSHYSITYP